MVALAGAYRLALRENLAPHLAARLLKTPGVRVATTLDADLQRYAVDVLRDHLAELADRAVGDGAVIVLDNATGDVLAWVGSSGQLSSAAQVDGVIAPRQAGSTLKPFLYAQALDARLLTAASLVDDSPVAIATERGAYIPQNYDRSFRGTVSVRTALASSLNVPAVRTVELVGIDRFYDTLRQLGLDSLSEPADFYGASLALGGADVTLITLANAYRTLANGGHWSATRVVAQATDSPQRRVFGRDSAFIIGDILSDRSARATSFRFGERSRDPCLERREDRHEQGHARQLVHRFHVALHRRRMGGQFFRRADARRLRRHRRRADLARHRASSAHK